ncbi:MAG TPA: BTAD domain-containing putative transcriptional regulator [Actinophytocola sp.]|uniref:AfsR/SARP family transcriptional regulator n=1 Tax=Actinophytocola sp. TaxID=1872138 RepID=UPI002F938CAC
MTDVAVRVLGSLEIRVGTQTMSPGGPRQRALFALLALSCNQVVPVDTIVEALWDNDPPDSAIGQIQTSVWRLRKLITGMAPGARRNDLELVTRPVGYMLTLDPAGLDLTAFQEAARQGQEDLRAERYEEAASRLRRGLDLWRGRAFDDVPGAFAQAEATRLEEQRLCALEDRIEADLALGRHRDLTPELTKLVREHPLRERIRGQLMLALHRSGRQAEALATYQEAYRLLSSEFALQPGEQLQNVHREVLAARPAGEAVEESAPQGPFGGPERLPADIADFTGRSAMLTQVRAVLSGTAPVAPIVDLSGAPGVGKTALAIRAANLLHDVFPDGRFYLDLQGLAHRPLSPDEALNRVVRWFAGPGVALCDDLEERAALLRSLLADRRVLLVLDNAQSEEQVRPLLPGAPGSAVLITGRRPLLALDNVTHYELPGFSLQEAVDLLAGIVGTDRVAVDRVAAREISQLCGHLPLAIRLVGAWLSLRPHWPLRHMADRLGDERRRLDALSIGDRGVRSSIALSYQALDGRHRALFRRLGALTGSDVPAWVAAALLDTAEPEAEGVIEELVEMRLVDARATGGPVARYGMHTLVRLFARERYEEEDADEAAVERLVGGWLYLAERAEARLPGGLPRIGRGDGRRWPVDSSATEATTTDAVGWFEAEKLALLSAVETACAYGLAEHAWDLVGCVGRFLEFDSSFDVWQSVLRRALAAVTAARNRRGEAYLLRGLGEVLLDADRYSEALKCLHRARELFADLGEARPEAHVERAIGTLERMRGDTDAAARRFERALVVFERTGDRVGMGDTLYSLGALHKEQGDPHRALTCYRQALAHVQALGDQFNESLLLCGIGSVLLAQGRADEARSVLLDGLAVARAAHADASEAYAHSFLGETDVLTGDLDSAADNLGSALSIFERIGDRYGEAMTRRNFGELHVARRDLGGARAAVDSALALWDQLDVPMMRGRALVTCGRLYLAEGDPDAANAAWREAAELMGERLTIYSDDPRRLLRESGSD